MGNKITYEKGQQQRVIKKSSPYNVALIGNSGVGKTVLSQMIVDKTYSDKYEPTIKTEFKLYKDQKTIVRFWELGGEHKFEDTTLEYYKNANGFIVMYDITNEKSFDNIKNLIASIYTHNDNPVMMLIGNKTDLENERKISFDKGKDLAKIYNISFMEICAKDIIMTKWCMGKMIEELDNKCVMVVCDQCK